MTNARLQFAVPPRIMRNAAGVGWIPFEAKGAVMRKAAIWAAFIVVCGSIGLAQAGAQAPAGGRGGEARTVVLEQAPKDKSIAIPKEKLAQYLKDMDAKKLQTLRMIEGGKYNVNIRRITAAETGLVHPITADLWVVLEGGGTLTTGGVLEKGKILGGQSRSITRSPSRRKSSLSI